MAQQPVENYGVVGDRYTIALVGKDGSIDFMCFPQFDSPTIFAALLDPERGGRFQLAPESADARHVQLYLPDSAILLTRFLFAEGVAEVSDFMPVESLTRALVRRVKTVRGEISFRMLCAPRFDYGRARHRVERRSELEWVFASEGADHTAFVLRSDVPLSPVDGDAVASFRLRAGQSASFII
jgi:GH15 family glucan-1,4-alpha-glucosidase